ncbi:hypothetical protein BC830DRAFT_1158863 [Chytriomyces sp. MP71]|nr:hypothetical protein BC830DRAFT_1158863 [Chytriomyces sp. MP71]
MMLTETSTCKHGVSSESFEALTTLDDCNECARISAASGIAAFTHILSLLTVLICVHFLRSRASVVLFL